MTSIQDFIKSIPLTFKVEKTFHNPYRDDSDSMDHWKCLIRNRQTLAQMTLIFSKGRGLKGEPATLEEVLDCLASDASGSEATFEDWCREYGYDDDSRKAERTYKVIQRQAKELKRVLGQKQYEQLVYETERL